MATTRARGGIVACIRRMAASTVPVDAPPRVTSTAGWAFMALLTHVECQRAAFRADAQRLSRHWYDLAMLAEMHIGRQALVERSLDRA